MSCQCIGLHPTLTCTHMPSNKSLLSHRSFEATHWSSSTEDPPSLLSCRSCLFTPLDGVEAIEADTRHRTQTAKWDRPPRPSEPFHPPRERFRLPNLLDKHPSLRFTRQMVIARQTDHLAKIAHATLQPRQKRLRKLKRKRTAETEPFDSKNVLLKHSVPISDRLMDAMDWNLTFEACGLPPLKLPVRNLSRRWEDAL
ncbi:hypothetical protein PHLGIDRAFT_421216 [Phlebiopsis gigantea 11061_1 CR5-6]|uniref:Uncharacterized protein n=1 Tax=Phlebiopsis gigantea (strain 11061_1 CR5-6) TaxID=745531 RepID=A0A0C3NQK8_PHLG1|nr:hypothetical protein PHLGIDRAFT_421216 [Phlebiopsis gigantea 11061_1 CR5-6]